MLTLYKNIRKLREMHGMSQEELALKTGYTSRSSIAKIEAGEVDLSQSKIIAFAKALNTTPQSLLGWDDNSDLIPITIIPDVWRIPIVTNVLASCGDGDFADDVILDYISMPANVFKRNRHKQYFAQIADGDSMINAGIEDGDVLVFESCDVPEDNVIGVFCVDNDKCFCKRYKFSNGKVYLLSANDNYLPKEFEPERVRMIGVLKWICKEYELVGK